MRMIAAAKRFQYGALLLSGLLAACQPTPPPAQRPAVGLPVLAGDIALGKQVFDTECSKCHQLQSGKNSKGPQLDRIYGATAGTLADYQQRYSAAIKASALVWDADTLDRYISHPDTALHKGKMLYDGLNDMPQRRALIAYLSTLRGADLPRTASTTP